MAEVTPEVYLAAQAQMDRPIPGMSLTNDPNNPAPYEQPPKFTNVHEANYYLWDYVTSENVYPRLMRAVAQGVPVMSMVEVILFNEFQQGSFNPDLMLMLAEPLAYMIIALAERLDLDIEIDNEDDEGDVFGVEMAEGKLDSLKERASKMGMVPQGMLSEEMVASMDNLPELGSLLSPENTEAPVAEEAAPQQPSLMAPPEGQ